MPNFLTIFFFTLLYYFFRTVKQWEDKDWNKWWALYPWLILLVIAKANQCMLDLLE